MNAPRACRRARRRWVGALACAATIFVASVSSAQARDGAAAEVLFREGRKAQEANDYQEACQKFGESQRLDPAPGTLMNLATCEEKLGKLASAWQHWKEALDALPPGDQRIAYAKTRIRDLESRLPRLTIVLGATAPPGAQVFRDDVELGKASQGVALPVDPGPHTVTVLSAGRRPESAAFTIADAEQRTLEVRAGPIDEGPVASGGAGARTRTLGWVVSGIGVAGLGTAAVTGILLANAKSTLQADCPNKMCRSRDGLDAASSGRTLVFANGAAWMVAAFGLGVGAYLVFAGGPDSTGVVPSVGPSGAALFYRGAFR